MSEALVPSRIREERIEQLIRLYEDRLLRMSFMYLQDRALAEDAVQETFIKAYKALSQFRGECNEETWLMRIAMNTCRDIRRGTWFRRMDRSVTPDVLPEPIYEQGAQDDSVVLEIMRLPERLRVVILLYYYQDMPVAEISKVISISPSAVYHRLSVAQKRLKERLERWYFDEER